MSNVAPRLWQGSRPLCDTPLGGAGIDLAHGRSLGIDVLVLAAEEYTPSCFEAQGIRVFYAQLDDAIPSQEELDRANQIASAVTREYVRGKRVLITCYMGLNRSGLITALVLRRAYGLTGPEAIRAVRAARPHALGNRHFCAYLESLQDRSPWAWSPEASKDSLDLLRRVRDFGEAARMLSWGHEAPPRPRSRRSPRCPPAARARAHLPREGNPLPPRSRRGLARRAPAGCGDCCRRGRHRGRGAGRSVHRDHRGAGSGFPDGNSCLGRARAPGPPPPGAPGAAARDGPRRGRIRAPEHAARHAPRGRDRHEAARPVDRRRDVRAWPEARACAAGGEHPRGPVRDGQRAVGRARVHLRREDRGGVYGVELRPAGRAPARPLVTPGASSGSATRA